jgi:hypothetical protein
LPAGDEGRPRGRSRVIDLQIKNSYD